MYHTCCLYQSIHSGQREHPLETVHIDVCDVAHHQDGLLHLAGVLDPVSYTHLKRASDAMIIAMYFLMVSVLEVR